MCTCIFFFLTTLCVQSASAHARPYRPRARTNTIAREKTRESVGGGEDLVYDSITILLLLLLLLLLRYRIIGFLGRRRRRRADRLDGSTISRMEVPDRVAVEIYYYYALWSIQAREHGLCATVGRRRVNPPPVVWFCRAPNIIILYNTQQQQYIIIYTC